MKPPIQSTCRADSFAELVRGALWSLDPAWIERFRSIDRWLCVNLKPTWARIAWHELWVRDDDFHPSLSLDLQAITQACRADDSGYRRKLTLRRIRAHGRSLAA